MKFSRKINILCVALVGGGLLFLSQDALCLDLSGPYKINNIAYIDGLAGGQFSALPAQCKNRDNWILNFNIPSNASWDIINTAYAEGKKVWIGVSEGSQGVCELWAISTVEFPQQKADLLNELFMRGAKK